MESLILSPHFVQRAVLILSSNTLKFINPGPAELGYAFVFANSVDPDQLASEEAN